MRSFWISGAAVGCVFALLLACFPDASTSLRLFKQDGDRPRNSLLVRCEDDMGTWVAGASLRLNATTPPADCFNVTHTDSDGVMTFNFTPSCEGFLQCEDDDCFSPPLKLGAYPSLPDPPTDQTMRMMFAIARQEEPIVLRSNVQGSITGQVRVMWHFAGSAGTNMYSPNGDKNSLVLVNLTTADDGDYFPLATATRLKFVKGWTNQKGQTYRLHVDIFERPQFTRNLTCNEEPGQLWRCITQATGTDINYQWFINDELLSNDDNRVSSPILSRRIVLHNLEPSDMHLMVQAYNTKNQHTYRITQSAAILVPAESCTTIIPCATTTLSPQSAGNCFLPWLPILGVAITFLVMISFGLGLFLCLCHGRSCLSYKSNDGIIKVEDHKGNKHQLCKDELKDDSLVLNWLSSVISTLDSGYVGNKLELHRILVKVRTDLNNYHLQHLGNIALDGDGDTGGIEMKKNPVITGLIEHLDQLLNPGHHYEAVQL